VTLPGIQRDRPGEIHDRLSQNKAGEGERRPNRQTAGRPLHLRFAEDQDVN
jgi:hypothetical protein